ncbi:MAG: hypothetical protein AB7T07_13380 [Steroidobacteraceae bacterium]
MARLAHPMKYVVVAAQGFFGGHSLFSGLNYFFEFFPLPQVMHPVAGPFVDAMTNMGLFTWIKAIEALVGFMLLFNVFAPLALIMELPTSITIFYMSVIVVHSERSVWTGSRELLLNVFLLAAYFGFYRPFLVLRAEQRPLWRGGKAEPMT